MINCYATRITLIELIIEDYHDMQLIPLRLFNASIVISVRAYVAAQPEDKNKICNLLPADNLYVATTSHTTGHIFAIVKEASVISCALYSITLSTNPYLTKSSHQGIIPRRLLLEEIPVT